MNRGLWACRLGEGEVSLPHGTAEGCFDCHGTVWVCDEVRRLG